MKILQYLSRYIKSFQAWAFISLLNGKTCICFLGINLTEIKAQNWEAQKTQENDKITEEFWSPDPFQYSLFTKHKGLGHSPDRKQVVSASLWKSTIYFAPRQPKLGRLAEPKLFTKR